MMNATTSSPPATEPSHHSQPSSHPGEPPNGPPSLAELLELVPDIGRSSAARSAADGSFDSGSTATPHAANSGTGDNYGYNEQQYNDEPAKEYNDYNQHGEAEADMDTALNIARICGRSASSCGYCKGSRAWVLMVDNPDPSTVFTSGGIGARAGGAAGGNHGQVGSNDRGMVAAGGSKCTDTEAGANGKDNTRTSSSAPTRNSSAASPSLRGSAAAAAAAAGPSPSSQSSSQSPAATRSALVSE